AGPDGAPRGRGRAGHDPAVLGGGRARGADRPAVDAGRAHRGEEAAVEARIARAQRAVADFGIEVHDGVVCSRALAHHARFSDMVSGGSVPRDSRGGATRPTKSARPGGALWRALRPHQWAKNLLLFVPLALTPAQASDTGKWLIAVAAFACWSAVASAGYLANDALDVAADRADPEKRGRPFASGDLA